MSRSSAELVVILTAVTFLLIEQRRESNVVLNWVKRQWKLTKMLPTLYGDEALSRRIVFVWFKKKITPWYFSPPANYTDRAVTAGKRS
jgi:hypothetical protein